MKARKKGLFTVLYGISGLLTVCLLFLDWFCFALWLNMYSTFSDPDMYCPATVEDIWFFGLWAIVLTLLVIVFILCTCYLKTKRMSCYENESVESQ